MVNSGVKTPKILFSDKRSRFMEPFHILSQIGLKEGDKFIDLGCGAGFFSLPAAKMVGKKGKVYAVDIQESMLEATRTKATQQNLENISFIQADIETGRGLEIRSNIADIVLISNVLFQVPNKRGVLHLAKNLVKKGGKVVVIEWEQKTPLGPSLADRVPKSEVINIAKDVGLNLIQELEAGLYHYALVFKIK